MLSRRTQPLRIRLASDKQQRLTRTRVGSAPEETQEALIPSERERQIDECTKRLDHTAYRDGTGNSKGMCTIMWDNSH